MKQWIKTTACSVICLGSAFANAALIDRGNGVIYDTQQDMSWLMDWGASGKKTWSEQVSWAENLSFAGGDNWSLPTIEQYLALSRQYLPQKTVGAPFINSQKEKYFSISEFSSGSLSVWLFDNGGAYKTPFLKTQSFYAAAVHPGDLASSVPEPSHEQLALVGALVAMIFSRARINASRG